MEVTVKEAANKKSSLRFPSLPDKEIRVKGNAKYHCYCVDYNGARLYSALYGKKFSWKKTDVIQPVYIMKKSFAKNQFLIAFLKHYDFKYELQPRLVWNEKSTTKTVIPTLQMTFQTSDKIGKTILMVEVLRMYQGWKEEYQEKLIRYENYLKSLEDTQKLNKYYLIVCAESEDHVCLLYTSDAADD